MNINKFNINEFKKFIKIHLKFIKIHLKNGLRTPTKFLKKKKKRLSP